MNATNVQVRNNVNVVGQGDSTLLFAHGFGCSQNMWRFMTPSLEDEFKLVTFDYVGSGQSDPKAFEISRYSQLEGYAQDILDVCVALDLSDVTLVGHSVSSMSGLIAAIEAPELISKLIMICPSPYFLNDPPQYYGGFERSDLEELLQLMDKNYIGWANHLAPLVTGLSGESLSDELADSFCSTDPLFAKAFAKATFFSDCRSFLGKASQPTLVLQSSEDVLASISVGQYIQSAMQQAEIEIIEANGHCLHMTHAQEITPGIKRFARS